MKRTVLLAAAAAFVLMTVGAKGCASTSTSSSSSSQPATTSSSATSGGSSTPTTAAPTTTTTVPARQVEGTAATLGAGTYTVGTILKPGLYTVTAGAGQSGNFVVQGTDSYDEILGATSDGGVPKVRTRLQNGDSVQLSGLSSVTFTPVASPYVTAVRVVHLYAGTWVVGQDIAPATYVATPGVGQSGNFIVEGNDTADEILGSASDGGVPSVTTPLTKGDIITISGMSLVTMTPQS